MISVANNTAPKHESVWKGLNEVTFRNVISALAVASKDLPGDSRNYSVQDWERHHPVHGDSQRSLSLEDEQRLADDFAFIAAFREGEISERLCVSSIFEEVVTLDRQRIHDRLRSKHWKPAENKRRGGISVAPLRKDLLALLPALCRNPNTKHLSEKLQDLCELYKAVDIGLSVQDEENQRLRRAVQASFDFCTAVTAYTRDALPSSSTKQRLSQRTPLESKHIKQIEKIGRYWDVCIFMTKATRRYSEPFQRLKLEILKPYSRSRMLDPCTKKAVNYYVHAEIQLVTFYGMTPKLEGLKPRVLGVSKSACYLCDLFISLHNQFFISKTHGRLYDQWTVPDLAAFGTAQRQQYRTILQNMYRVCKSETLKSSASTRQCPPESTYDFHAYMPLSPLAATTVTQLSSQTTIRGPSPSQQLQSPVNDPSEPAPDDTTEAPTAGSVSVEDLLDSKSTSVQSSGRVRDHSAVEGLERGELMAGIDRLVSAQDSESQTPAQSATRSLSTEAAALSLEHTITHQAPYRLDIHGMRITFEIEEPQQGRITIKANSTAVAHAIDVDTVMPGDVLDFYRENEPASLRLDLCRKHQRPVCLELEWLLS
ncbi:MAG: hypothetical protein LQ338_001471 [Usnochroma carphineum]|nr:MAG: hypothetical protein LQ338_001471 [Usnochroma carphineum]